MTSGQQVIACKRPKVSVGRVTGRKGYVASCEVSDETGSCDWTYPRTDRGIALVSDAEYHASMHRAQHRSAARRVEVEDGA